MWGFSKMTTPRRRGALALAVAVLWLVGQAAGTVHMLVVPHVFCAEHGELVESELPSGVAAADADVDPQFDSASSSLQRDASNLRGSHAHDHCFVASRAQRSTPSFLRSRPATERVYFASRPEARADAPRGSQVAVFRLAPKNSPPA
jgi:hypothetical protein